MSTLKIFHKKKILLVFLLCAAMLVGLVGRLGYLMLFQSEYYHKKATDLHERERDIKGGQRADSGCQRHRAGGQSAGLYGFCGPQSVER